MIRAIIFFAVFTITAAAPTPVQETPNEFYDARNGVDKDPSLLVRNKNNEIMENWPLNGYINFETNRGRENLNNIFEETTENNINSVEKNPSKILHHSIDNDEDIKDNLVDTDDEISSNYKESPSFGGERASAAGTLRRPHEVLQTDMWILGHVFITFIVEFVKAISEQIMAAYKN